MIQEKDRSAPQLIVLFSSSSGGGSQVFVLEKEEYTIGRDPGVDISLPDRNISRTHAKVIRQDGSYTIIDLGARNGTYVNGKRVRQSRLSCGDIITIGKSQLIFSTDRGHILEVPTLWVKGNSSSAFSTEMLSVEDLASEVVALTRKVILLHWLGRILQEKQPFEVFCRKVLVCLKEGIGAERGALFLEDIPGQGLELVADVGGALLPQDQVRKVVLETLAKGQGFVSHNTDDPSKASYLTFPLGVHRRSLGMLYFEGLSEESLEEHSLHYLSIGTTILCAHLENLSLIRRLRAAQKDLKEHTTFGELLACIAHELKNPITTARGFAELLSRSLEETPSQKWSERVEEELERSVRIIESMLQFARKRTSALQQGDLNALIQSLLHRRKQSLPPDIHLEVHLAQEPIWVQMDSLQMEQVLNNLWNNACDALEEAVGDKRLVVTSWQDKKWGYVALRDTGPGIPKEQRANIFQPFYTTKQKGTGLGLSLCQHIVRAHSGEILLRDPEEGPGIEVVVKLPLWRGR